MIPELLPATFELVIYVVVMHLNLVTKRCAQRLFRVAVISMVCGMWWSCRVPPQPNLPQVILKLDDAWFEDDSIHLGWVKTFEYLNAKQVRATIGIVGERMENANPSYCGWLKRQARAGHEIWNHGYCHCKPVVDGKELREFRGTDYQYQLEHLQKTQALAMDKLDLKLETFGAPYNACDSNTIRALSMIPELRTWLYPPNQKIAGKFAMPRIGDVNIEYPVHQPNFAAFVAGFRAHLEEPVLVIQGHPRSWMEPRARMTEFQKIIDFLVAEGVRFTTPSAYRESMEE